MTRKFLFCFPLRVGNIVFGYTVIIIAVAVMAYNLYCLGMTVVPEKDQPQEEKFRNWENVEILFGQDKSKLVFWITILYYLSYMGIGLLLFVFSALFVCGVYKANQCLVSMFFVYSFFHLFLTVGLVVWEATSGGYVQLGLIILSDVLLIICLFGVRYFIEAIHSGNIYSRPGEVLYKY